MTTEVKKRATKTERLAALANKRVPKALKALALVGGLAGYNPTEEQSEKILDAIDAAVKKVKESFNTVEEKAEAFEL